MNDLNLTKAQQLLLRAANVHALSCEEADREIFGRRIGSFVPPDSFDFHAHLYDLSHLLPQLSPEQLPDPTAVDHSTLVRCMQQWMGERVVQDGLYFGFPLAGLDCRAANDFVIDSLADAPGSSALMLIRPDDDPAEVESTLLRQGFVGFKVYHVFAAREDTFAAEQGEFLPDWAWEIANRHELVIMMHMVLDGALSDVRNQQYIQNYCRQYPHAHLILAHAARGFNANHTVQGIASLRGIPNVWFDTSAVCESAGMEAILRNFGPSRLLYGSDFPVSEMRGRCVSIGDGFYWLHDYNAEWNETSSNQPQLVGVESLLALQQACRTMALRDSDVEQIFSHNARQLLAAGKRRRVAQNTSEIEDDNNHVQTLYQRAKTLIPGGTQLLSKRPEMFAPGRWPAYFQQAIGCEVVDTDGNRYVDMSHCGILSCVLGYADPDVNDAVIRRVHLGSMATQQTADEVELAQLLVDIHSWADQARFTRTGGEAMAAAVRVARAVTGRSKVAVCGYHGWHDWYLAANLQTDQEQTGPHRLDSHLLPGLEPTGVPAELAGTVATFQYNDFEQLESALDRCGDQLAAVVMEPTRSVDPIDGFLEAARDGAHQRGALLVFDEISSAWRLCLGGAHRMYDVEPDLAVFAKGMSNGFPMAAVIGQADAMQACQDSFISSTYWTEGVGPAAAVASIKKMQRIDVPAHLKEVGTQVMQGWRELATKHELPVLISGRPASCMLSFDHPDNAALLTLMTNLMLARGYLVAGICSLTLAHTQSIVARYLETLDQVFGELAVAISENNVHQRLDHGVKHSGFRRLT